MSKSTDLDRLMKERIIKKLNNIIVYKSSFVYNNYTVHNVPYNIQKGISNPIDEDLSLSGLVLMRLVRILKHMKEHDLLIYDYEDSKVE